MRTDSGRIFIPKGLQTFTYDDDGNLLSDGVWDYTYDAENRLASMQHRAEVIGAGMIATANARRLEFKYDYQGRRVRKTVYHQWNGTTYSATPLSDTKYFYVGWNLTAEFVWNPSTSTFDLNRSFTWGLDLTGSLTAAGGVGALLQIHDHTGTGKTLLPAYDGNGNVTALLNADTGALEAAYEYDPFGNPLRAEGTYAKDNPFRFSTKFTDNETGLVYYGLRYYSPSLGRFINRDPIDESGGLNLYAFVGNRVPNAFDLLGLDIVDGRGNYQADGGGGILFVSNTDPGSAPTVHNPSEKQRKAMDDYSRLVAALQNAGASESQARMLADDIFQNGFAATIAKYEAASSGSSGGNPTGGDSFMVAGGGTTSISVTPGGQEGPPGGNRYDPVTERFYRPDGSSYTTSVDPGPIKVLGWQNPNTRGWLGWEAAYFAPYVPDIRGPSALDRLTANDHRQGMINSGYRAPRPGEALMAAARETFGNAVFQRPLTSLVTALVQTTALVGISYGVVAAVPPLVKGLGAARAIVGQGGRMLAADAMEIRALAHVAFWEMEATVAVKAPIAIAGANLFQRSFHSNPPGSQIGWYDAIINAGRTVAGSRASSSPTGP